MERWEQKSLAGGPCSGKDDWEVLEHRGTPALMGRGGQFEGHSR